jgi:cysteine-rich repeat protein
MSSEVALAGDAEAPPSGGIDPGTPAEPEMPPPCWPSECGNGQLENGEACDDGNITSSDGCTECLLEPTCSTEGCQTVCGDGIVVTEAGEECDDGNLSSFDGCDGECRVEAGFVCTAVRGGIPVTAAPVAGDPTMRSECVSVCGDGIEVADEQCDDGDANAPGYGNCSTECTPGGYCGDGIVESGFELCDDGQNLTRYDATVTGCAPGCVPPGFCGDTVVQSDFGETCDDGNRGSGDGCSAGCINESVPTQPPPTNQPAPVPVPTHDVFIPDVPTSDDPGALPAPNPCR